MKFYFRRASDRDSTRILSLWLDILGRTSNTVDHRHPRISDSCIMVSKKRNLEDDTSSKPKKPKLAAEASTDKKKKKMKANVKAEKPLETTSNIVSEEIDFPRGGGTTFTPQEVKAIRAEAMTEADDLFKVRMKYVVFVSSLLIRCVKGKTSTEVEKVTQKLRYQE